MVIMLRRREQLTTAGAGKEKGKTPLPGVEKSSEKRQCEDLKLMDKVESSKKRSRMRTFQNEQHV